MSVSRKEPEAGPSDHKKFEFVPYAGPAKKGRKIRPILSCESCRRRKIKCLNDKVPCKPCLEYGEICSLLDPDEAQDWRPPPPEVLKDQGIKVKRRRKSSGKRAAKRIKKAVDDEPDTLAAAATAGADESEGHSEEDGPSTSAKTYGGRLDLPRHAPSFPLQPLPPRPPSLPRRSTSQSSLPPQRSNSPPLSHGESTKPLVIRTDRPTYVLAPPSHPSPSAAGALPSFTLPRASPLANNSLGSLPIRRDSASVSPAAGTTALQLPYDFDARPSSSSSSFQPPSFSLPVVEPPLLSNPTPARSDKTPKKAPTSFDFLLCPWSPSNDAIGPGSIRPRPLEPLPALQERTDAAKQAGLIGRQDTLVKTPLLPVIEESPEDRQGLSSPAPPPLLTFPTPIAKSEALSTPASLGGALPRIAQSPSLSLNGLRERHLSHPASNGTPNGTHASPGAAVDRSPLPHEVLSTIAEPALHEQATLQDTFVRALGWLFPWYGMEGLGRGSRAGQWAIWSFSVRLQEPRDKTATARARAFFNRAKEAFAVYSGEPTLEHLAAAILISWAGYGLSESARATWVWCGTAIKMAEDLGLYDPDPGILQRLSVVLQSLYQLDKILSIHLHRLPSFSLASPLARLIPRAVSDPSTVFEAVSTLCAFLGQIAQGEYSVRTGEVPELVVRRKCDEILQDLVSWLGTLKGRHGLLGRKDEGEDRGRVWVELWLQGIFVLLNSPRLLNPQALPMDINIDVARSAASVISTTVQTRASFQPSVLLSPFLDVPIHFALATIESDIEAMASLGGLAGLGQEIMKDQRVEESRALRAWLRMASAVWGF